MVVTHRLEMEEQARQKLQLDKVAAESKIKKLEETLAVNEDTSAKVSFFGNHLYYFMFITSMTSLLCQKLWSAGSKH